jgi:hypothetical protein
VLRAQLLEAVAGVELGHYDQYVIDWLAGWDVPIVAVMVSLLHRVRAEGDQ